MSWSPTPEQRARYRERQAIHQRARRAERQAIVNAAKAVPCMDCGESFPPYVMDLDHVRGDKIKGVAYMVGHHGTYSDQVLVDEIAKCDVVCANCHRRRTYGGDR